VLMNHRTTYADLQARAQWVINDSKECVIEARQWGEGSELTARAHGQMLALMMLELATYNWRIRDVVGPPLPCGFQVDSDHVIDEDGVMMPGSGEHIAAGWREGESGLRCGRCGLPGPWRDC